MAVNDGRRLNRNPSKPTMNFGQGNYSPRNPSCRKQQNGDYPVNKPPQETPPPESEHVEECTASTPKPVYHRSGFLEYLVGDKIDSEKLMLAALIFLLLKEGADMKLILALGYILL